MPEGKVYTYADLATFPDDNLRREIIDGELFVTAAPFLRHQKILLELAYAFVARLKIHGGGEVYVAPADVVLSDVNVVEPDLLFVPDDRRDILTERNLQGAPTLVVEVVSDTRMDRVRKRDLYERFGVPEYWIVDPEADRVEVYRLTGDGYAKPEILEPDETLTYDGLPGLEIDLTQLFAR
jgi:Uma2 family endonuclease